MFKIVFIGAGNVATQIATTLQKIGMNICQIYSRTENSASTLGKLLNIPYTTDKTKVIGTADVYFCCVKDSEIENALNSISFNNGLLVHTAGSVPIEVLQSFSENVGVFYPLQTLSKEKKIEWKKIPLYLEANTPENIYKLHQIAEKISDCVFDINSEQRGKIHLAAVFCSNFVNHLYTLSDELLAESGFKFQQLIPLIEETTEKVKTLSPIEAQTGPAVRFDENIINKHLNILRKQPDQKAEIYSLLSKSIYEKHHIQ